MRAAGAACVSRDVVCLQPLLSEPFLVWNFFHSQQGLISEEDLKEYNLLRPPEAPQPAASPSPQLSAVRRCVPCLELTLAEYDINRLLTWWVLNSQREDPLQ